MRAAEAAMAAGVSVKALRYYEACGLLRPARLSNGYRDYSVDDVAAASQIRRLISMGWASRETAPFVDCLRAGHPVADDCPESLAAYQAKIDQIDDLICRLGATRNLLVDRLAAAIRRGFPESSQQEVSMLPQPDPLPDDLPPPEDDGQAQHLPGLTLPPLTYTASDGSEVRLDSVATGRWLLFLYPLTGKPGTDMPRGWDQIPGARGCSQEACGFRDNLAGLRSVGVQRVLAMSTDLAAYQKELANRLHLPYPMLSDPELRLAEALRLPTFQAAGMTLYKRLTMVVDAAKIIKVFYPVFPPDRHAEEVLAWAREHPVARA